MAAEWSRAKWSFLHTGFAYKFGMPSQYGEKINIENSVRTGDRWYCIRSRKNNNRTNG